MAQTPIVELSSLAPLRNIYPGTDVFYTPELQERLHAWIGGWIESLMENFADMTPEDAFHVLWKYLGYCGEEVFSLAHEMGFKQIEDDDVVGST